MTRPACLIAGLATLAVVWIARLPLLMPGAFSAHMTMHMGVVALAAPLLALGLAGGRFDPVPRAPRIFAPLAASLVEFVAVWAWHAPLLHQFARATWPGLALEQATFLASGVLVWLAAFGGERHARAERSAAGVLALLLTSMHMTLLGALLALSPRALYDHHAHAGGAGVHASGQLSALSDQHLGGAIMLLAGGLAYLIGGLALTAEILRRRNPALRVAGAARKGVVP